MQAGNIAVISHATRNNPGIFGTESRDLRYENVTIHHCEGMAFIHQLCENIRLERCRVVPSEGRMISAAADATHFVNCTGTVELKDCAFFSQLDDATNVHGIYTLVKDIVGNRPVSYTHLPKGAPCSLTIFKFIRSRCRRAVLSPPAMLTTCWRSWLWPRRRAR